MTILVIGATGRVGRHVVQQLVNRDARSGVAAVGVFLWSATVMLAGDHFVWPKLVGGSARLPFLLAFVGIFGGLAAFGLFGLFLGRSLWRPL